MNTIVFNVFLALFCLLYILHFSFWFRLKKYAPFKNSPQSRLYTFLAPAIIAVCVIAIGLLFIMDSGVKFRLSLMIVLTAPILITHLRAAIAADPIYEALVKRCRLVRATSTLLYLTIIPLTIVYCL
jgi:hypothetical protein